MTYHEDEDPVFAMSELKRLRAENADLREEIKRCEAEGYELDAFRAENEALRRDNADLRRDEALNELQARYDRLAAEFNILSGEWAEKYDALTELRAKYDRLEKAARDVLPFVHGLEVNAMWRLDEALSPNADKSENNRTETCPECGGSGIRYGGEVSPAIGRCPCVRPVPPVPIKDYEITQAELMTAVRGVLHWYETHTTPLDASAPFERLRELMDKAGVK